MDTDGEDSHFELSTSVCASVRNLSGNTRIVLSKIDLSLTDVRGDRFK